MSEKIKENNAIERLLLRAVWLFGGGVFIGAVAALVEAVSKFFTA